MTTTTNTPAIDLTDAIREANNLAEGRIPARSISVGDTIRRSPRGPLLDVLHVGATPNGTIRLRLHIRGGNNWVVNRLFAADELIQLAA